MKNALTVRAEERDIVVERRRSGRARRASLTVHPDGRAVLSMPRWMDDLAAERFVQEQAEWLRRQLARVSKFKDHVFLPRDRRTYLARKEEARQLVAGCVERVNATYGFRFGRISIKNLRMNWGSCSVRGNLNFNYKLVFLPPRLAEYVVAHELCHLREFNHSPRFWNLVARVFPDHRELRKALRTYRA